MDTREIITWGANPDLTYIIIIIIITKEKIRNKATTKKPTKIFSPPLPTRAAIQPFGLVP